MKDFNPPGPNRVTQSHSPCPPRCNSNLQVPSNDETNQPLKSCKAVFKWQLQWRKNNNLLLKGATFRCCWASKNDTCLFGCEVEGKVTSQTQSCICSTAGGGAWNTIMIIKLVVSTQLKNIVKLGIFPSRCENKKYLSTTQLTVEAVEVCGIVAPQKKNTSTCQGLTKATY